MNATTEKLIEVLNDGVTDQIRIDAAELARSVDLEAGQVITWLSTAQLDPERVHIFFCEADGEDEEFLSTRHDEAGLLLGYDGPFCSFEEAKRMAGAAGLGWLDV